MIPLRSYRLLECLLLALALCVLFCLRPANISAQLQDSIPPADIKDLEVASVTATSVSLSWTAPGDDDMTGQATSYELRFSTSNITNYTWPTAALIPSPPKPEMAGSKQEYTIEGLNPDTVYFFAIKTLDDEKNSSNLSNLPSAKTMGLSHFTLSQIDSQVPAGLPFDLTITAIQEDNQTASFFKGTVSLVNTRDFVPLETSAFSNGLWIGAITPIKLGEFLLVVTDGNHYGTSNPFTVVPGPLDKIIIEPTGFNSITAGMTQSLTCQGVDSLSNEIEGLVYQWSTTIGQLSPQTGSQTTFSAGTKSGYGSITVRVDTQSTTVRIEVAPGPLSSLVITPDPAAMTVTTKQLFKAQGVDHYGNPLSGLSPAWSLTPNFGQLSALKGSQTTLTAGTRAGTFLLKATLGNLTGLATITLLPDVFHYLIISPEQPNIQIEHQQQIKATGFDFYGNPIPDLSFNWFTEIGSLSSTLGSITTLTMGTKAQTGCLRISLGSFSLSAKVTALPGPVHYLILNPAIATLTVNSKSTFTVSAFDKYDNFIPDFQYRWQAIPEGLGRLSPIIGPETTLHAGLKATNGWLKVQYGSMTIQASVTTLPERLDHLTIVPSIIFLVAGQPMIIHGQGRDKYENPIEMTDAEWDVNIGSLSQTSATQTTLECKVSSTGWIKYMAMGLTATASLIAQPGEIKGVVILPASVAVLPGETISLAAFGCDNYQNLIELTCGIWSLDDGGSLSTLTGTQTVFTAGTKATTIQPRFQLGSMTATGRLTITPSDIHHLAILPSSLTLEAGESISLQLEARDIYDNPISLIPGFWTALSSSGSFSSELGSQTIFTAGTRATTGSITAGWSNLLVVLPLTITPATITLLQITPSITGVRVASINRFTVCGLDPYENAVDNLCYSWSISPQLGIISPSTGSQTTLISNKRVSSGTITVQSNNLRTDLPVRLIPGEIDHFNLEFISEQTAGQGFGVKIEARDAFDNIITTYSGIPTLITPEATLTVRCQAGVGIGTVTINQAQPQARLRVIEGNISGSSNPFQVRSAGINRLDLKDIPAQYYGQPFEVIITAKDAFGNTIIDYCQPVTITENTNTAPVQIVNFNQGVASLTLTINSSSPQAMITVLAGSMSSRSNLFAVIIPSNSTTTISQDRVRLNIEGETFDQPFYLRIIPEPQEPERYIADAAFKQACHAFKQLPRATYKIEALNTNSSLPVTLKSDKKVRLTLPYEEVSGINQETIHLYQLKDRIWQELSSEVDRANHYVSAQIDQLGYFTIAGSPIESSIIEVYPNPFRPDNNQISFVGLSDNTTIKVYDLAGDLVCQETANQRWDWNVQDEEGKAVASGVYIYTISQGGEIKQVGRLAIIR